MFDYLPFVAGSGPLGACAGIASRRRSHIPQHDRQKWCQSEKIVASDKIVASAPILAIKPCLIR
jgi:hypothetical protein